MIATVNIDANHASGKAVAMPRKSQDKTEPRGVGLKTSEWEEIEKMAQELGITPHAVLQYGIRYFMKDYRAGKIKAQAKKIRTLPDL